MAEKSSSRIRFDDVVNAVHADPANVEPTVLLAGYLGRSTEEGHVRVYLDPSLCNWLEVPEAEVIHTRPIADSPLGGSQLWVRASAQLKPGVAGAPAPAAGEEGGAEKAEGGADKAAVGADTGVFNPMATIHPTIWTQFCPTGVGCIATIPCLPPSIGCPPAGADQAGLVGPTGTQGCTQPGHCVGQTGWHTCACPIGPTGWHTCACPIGPTGYQGCGGGGTAATVCTQLGCPTHMLGCPSTSTCPPTHMLGCPNTSTCPPTHMLGCPSTSTCPPAALAAVGPTGTQGCTQPGQCVGQTGWHTGACPIGPTGTQGCVGAEAIARPVDPTAATRCFICPPLDPTAATRCFICPPIEAQPGPIGPTGTQGCTQPPHCLGQTGWHTCACPIGPTGWQGCGTGGGYPTDPTASTRCFICPPIEAGGAQAAAVGPTGTQGCTHICGAQQSTAATLCTQVGCRQAGGAVITLLTVAGCQHPSWVDACPTRLCGITVSGPCLPYTMGGCVREALPPSHAGCPPFQTAAPWHC